MKKETNIGSEKKMPLTMQELATFPPLSPYCVMDRKASQNDIQQRAKKEQCTVRMSGTCNPKI